jgi:hypothetical protein
MPDDFDDEDWSDINQEPPKADRVSHVLRWLSLFIAIGLLCTAVLMANE